jgi:hypothetical protein
MKFVSVPQCLCVSPVSYPAAGSNLSATPLLQ